MAANLNLMNYTYRTAEGEERKIVDVDMKEVKQIQKKYELSTRFAILEWAYRNGKLPEDEYLAFGIDLSSPAPEMVAQKKRKAPARKVDVDKKTIIAGIADFLSEGGLELDTKDIVIENDQRVILFTVGSDTYSLTLARKRKPKGE